MQVQPISQQSFGAVVMDKITQRALIKRTSKVEYEAIENLVKQQADNPVEILLSTNSAGLFSGKISSREPECTVLCSESIFTKVTPLEFIRDLCRDAELVRTRKPTTEELEEWL